MHLTRKTVKAERGAALVEAAIILPILMMLTFGIWTTSRAWNIRTTMDHAAREAARYAATIDPWDAGTSPGVVRALADADMGTSSIDIALVNTTCIELISDTSSSCDGSHTNNTGTDQIFVKLTYPNYTLDFIFFTTVVSFDTTAVSRYENSP